MKISPIVLAVLAILGMDVAAAHAGICTRQVNQFEMTMRQSPMGADGGPTAPETIGAQLGHQPTPASVEAAETSAQSRLAHLLANAKALDARGKHAACMHALNDAKMMFEPQ
jgi:hypothetical protein